MNSIRFGVVIAATLAGLAPTSANAGDDQLRSATWALFRAIESPKDFTPCAFDMSWMAYAVPENLARRYLGLTLHADVSAPFEAVPVTEVFDERKAHKASFCDQARREQLLRQTKSTFEESNEKKSSISFLSVTYPVFSNHLKYAAIVRKIDTESFIKNGVKIYGPSPFITIYAVVYHNFRGVWREVKSERLAIAE